MTTDNLELEQSMQVEKNRMRPNVYYDQNKEVFTRPRLCFGKFSEVLKFIWGRNIMRRRLVDVARVMRGCFGNLHGKDRYLGVIGRKTLINFRC